MGPQVEPFDDGVRQIVVRLERRIGRPADVTISRSAGIAGPSDDLSANVYDPTTPSGRSRGTRLVLMALCADSAIWPSIHEAFEAEGFEPATPEPDHGRVFYRSRTRALLVVPTDPRAERAVDRVGKALLTEVV